ncbi:hypothetical protein [Rhodohalobacter mucosus]|uniref:Uncharacterized protein n=1 Tax=Rhodohalobacter mucosus TaxID=2079485 RepID=A0A316TND3_9BACT|nr:hypothetical protein [Rhodohalobacter mucosus]PWN06107.1 hypothetical protein DDZ15_09645 [Rhodohalobacter mucosus]
MWNQLIQALCDLSAKLDSLLQEMRGSGPGSEATGSGKRIGTSISPVMRQGSSPVRLVNANPGRLGVIVHNNSSGELMIALDGQRITENHYTFKIRAGETLHFDLRTFGELYKGAFMGLWDGASGAEVDSKALVTEIFWTN